MFGAVLKVIGAIVVGLFVLVVVASCLAVSGGDGGSDRTASSAPAEGVKSEPVDEAASNIKIDTCEVTDLGGTRFAEPSYTITNPTSKASDYTFSIAVIDSTGATVSQASGFEPNVLPGRPSKGKAMGNVSDSAVAPYTCEVADVTRFASQ